MTTIARLTLLAVLATGLGADEKKVFSGYLVDTKCGTYYLSAQRDQLREHSRQCALSCGGPSKYGLVVGDKLITFDAQGGQMAKSWLEQSKKDKDLRVTVEFRVKGEDLIVEKIEADSASGN